MKKEQKVIVTEPTEQTKEYEKVLKADADLKSEEEQKKKKEAPARTMEGFLADKEEQANARKLGEDVQVLVSSNWFDMKRYCKKTRRGVHEAYLQLNLLEQFGHLAIENRGRIQYYKVVFDTIDQQQLVKDKIAHHELHLKMFKNQLKELVAKQKKIDKKEKVGSK
jgi:hypothetical protein